MCGSTTFMARPSSPARVRGERRESVEGMLQFKYWNERLLERRMVGRRLHDVGHVIPPFAHDGEFGQALHRMVVRARQYREQMMRVVVEKDAVIAHAGVVQCIDEFRPDLPMPAFVFVAHAGVQYHPESDCLHAGLVSSVFNHLFLPLSEVASSCDYNSGVDNISIRSWDWAILKPNR